jgi:hypothetical protein
VRWDKVVVWLGRWSFSSFAKWPKSSSCNFGVVGWFETAETRDCCARLAMLEPVATSSSLNTSHLSMAFVWLVWKVLELLRDCLNVVYISRLISRDSETGAAGRFAGGASTGLLWSFFIVSVSIQEVQKWLKYL